MQGFQKRLNSPTIVIQVHFCEKHQIAETAKRQDQYFKNHETDLEIPVRLVILADFPFQQHEAIVNSIPPRIREDLNVNVLPCKSRKEAEAHYQDLKLYLEKEEKVNKHYRLLDQQVNEEFSKEILEKWLTKELSWSKNKIMNLVEKSGVTSINDLAEKPEFLKPAQKAKLNQLISLANALKEQKSI